MKSTLLLGCSADMCGSYELMLLNAKFIVYLVYTNKYFYTARFGTYSNTITRPPCAILDIRSSMCTVHFNSTNYHSISQLPIIPLKLLDSKQKQKFAELTLVMPFWIRVNSW